MKRTTWLTALAASLSLGAVLSFALPLPAAPPASPSPTTLRSMYAIAPVSALEPRATALVLVDFQEEFVNGRLPLPDGPRAIAAASELLRWARANAIPVAHVQNVVTRPNSPIFVAGAPNTRIVVELRPSVGEHVVTKASGGAFTKTELDAWLRGRGIDTIVVAGLMTHLAVHLTASDAAVLGYRVIVAADATASRDLPAASGGRTLDHQVVHDVALASMADRFAEVLSVRQIEQLVPRR